MITAEATPWQRGRFDGRKGPSKILFGRMYEDTAIELAAFAPRGRIFCIASAACTAMDLAAAGHDVVAIDLNRDQLDYAAARIAGKPAVRGTAERVMAFGRTFGPLVGWSRARLLTFLDLDDPEVQLARWQHELDTRRFRAAFATMFSVTALRAIYASPFLAFLPPNLAAVLRGRMARCFGRHPNRTNPYARALLLGELPTNTVPAAAPIELVHGDAADYLERAPAASFDGFTLSNILDGADATYRARLFAAVRHAATPDAISVLRSFREPREPSDRNRAADDRAMLWGIVDVRRAATAA